MNYPIILLLVLLSFDVDAVFSDDCDPMVFLHKDLTTTRKALTSLATQHNFKLSFPVSADREIESPGKLPLSKMLRYLTSGGNSFLQTEKVEGCKTGRVISLEILPVGKDPEYVYVEPPPIATHTQKKKAATEPLIIDDMDLYAEEVLLKKRKSDRRLMSKEQKQTFRKARRAAKKRLIEQGLIEPKRNRRPRERANPG